MDGKELFPTSEGTPQGGVISPLLANIALHGLENKIRDLAESLKMWDSNGRTLSRINRRKAVSVIRYADDFVIIHEDLSVIQRCQKGVKRHPNKGRNWIRSKYFQTIGGDNWTFATSREGSNPMVLMKHSQTAIVRHVKVKGNKSPYDGDLIYWSSRMGKHPEMPKRTASLLKKQKGKCVLTKAPDCELFFRDGDLLEVDHIVPRSKGGKNEYRNYQLLHRHCHDEKSRTDGSYLRLPIIPEDYQWENDMLVTC